MRRTASLVASLAIATAAALLMAPTALSAPTPSAAAAQPADQSLDARAAAGANHRPQQDVGIEASWYTGTVAAGASQNWRWNNAPLTAAYRVGFAPTGASTAASCQFEVTRSWYVQQYGGEREFHFTVKNVGSIACASEILLSSLTGFTSWSTGGMNPGASGTWHWNNAPATTAYVVGLSPTGATNTSTCQFEVTRTWYEQQTSGEREFYFTVKNVGSIACVADIRLAGSAASTSWSTGAIAAGGSSTSHWNNAPANLVFVPALAPDSSNSVACRLEVTREWDLQRINSDGSAEREFYFTIKNLGSSSCSGTIMLDWLTA